MAASRRSRAILRPQRPRDTKVPDEGGSKTLFGRGVLREVPPPHLTCLAAQCETPPHIAQYPFEIVSQRGYRTHLPCFHRVSRKFRWDTPSERGGIAPPLRMLSKGENAQKRGRGYRTQLAMLRRAKGGYRWDSLAVSRNTGPLSSHGILWFYAYAIRCVNRLTLAFALHFPAFERLRSVRSLASSLCNVVYARFSCRYVLKHFWPKFWASRQMLMTFCWSDLCRWRWCCENGVMPNDAPTPHHQIRRGNRRAKFRCEEAINCALVARAICNAIRANRFARIIRNWDP